MQQSAYLERELCVAFSRRHQVVHVSAFTTGLARSIGSRECDPSPTCTARWTLADLEENAFKRDKRFVVRLVLTLVVAAVGAALVWGRLTSAGTASCAADTFLDSARE